MKIGAMNNPKLNLKSEIKWIGENGFDFIDLTIEPPNAYTINIEAIKQTLKDYDLEAIGHTNPSIPSIYPIQSIKSACLDEFIKYIDIFSKLEISLMNIHPSYFAPFLSNEEKIIKNIQLIKKVNRYCKVKGITLMLENDIEPFDTPEVFSRIIDEIPDLDINLDVGHCNINQEKNLTQDFFKTFGNKIVHLHLSDNMGKSDDHLPLGCGNIEWNEIIEIIKKEEYDKTFTLEIFSRDKDYILLNRNKFNQIWSQL